MGNPQQGDALQISSGFSTSHGTEAHAHFQDRYSSAECEGMILNVRIYNELEIYFPPTSPNGANLHSFPYSRLLLFGEQAEGPGDGTRCV